MCDAGLERVGAPRQRACQLLQGLPGCATNCSNKGDVMQSCSVDQRLWQLGNARWQIRQSARAARHRALHRHVRGGASKARSRRAKMACYQWQPREKCTRNIQDGSSRTLAPPAQPMAPLPIGAKVDAFGLGQLPDEQRRERGDDAAEKEELRRGSAHRRRGERVEDEGGE